MRLVSYDFEVFAYDWLVVLKDKETGIRTRIHNDNEALKMALSDDSIYVGFNSKHYDQFIAKAVAAGFTPQEVKTEYVLTPNTNQDNDYNADEIRERYIAADQQKRLEQGSDDSED